MSHPTEVLKTVSQEVNELFIAAKGHILGLELKLSDSLQCIDELKAQLASSKAKEDDNFYIGLIQACASLTRGFGAAQIIIDSGATTEVIATHCSEYDLRELRTSSFDLPLGCDFGNEVLPQDLVLNWVHPSYPSWWDELTTCTEYAAWLDSHGLQQLTLDLNNEPDEVVAAFEEDFDVAIKVFRPTAPEGDGWILWAVYDTEDDGIQCEWVKKVVNHG